ncbi:MAG: PilZ domain-containing protein [Sphingomonadaceae bacterium]|nr:PilZ domain-containing protein [Sphingomonadaceae bacterium]
MASAPRPPPEAPPHRRAAARLRVCIPGKLILLGGEYDCALEDVSLTGARVVSDAPMTKDQQGILQCTPLEVLFTTRWVHGKAAGLEFEEEVGLGTIRMLRWHNDRYRETHDAELRDMMQDWVAGKTR